MELGLSKSLVNTLTGLGFITPTPIQAQAIPKLLEDEHDLVGLAQTGTGKTAAFALPLIDLIDTNLKHTQALILAPTRELCLQITGEIKQFGQHIKKLKIEPVYGGADIKTQIKACRKGVQIIVATPGRLIDMIKRKVVSLEEVEYVVLDEADEMLNMGFKEEIDKILESTPEEKLTWLFSATMPPQVRKISTNYMTNPVELSVRGSQISNVDIDHQYVRVYPSGRYDVLKRFLDFNPEIFGLIFCRTKRECKALADQLTQEGYNADALHGDLNQNQRDRVMAKFRSRQLDVLVATDVAARGIDVQEITHVFHFNIPDDLAFYTHRSGRTGRAGRKGISLVLAHPNDVSILRRLEKRIKVDFTEAKIPTGEQICKQKILDYIRGIRNAQVNEELDEYLPEILEELEEFSKLEIVQRLAALSIEKFIKKYKNAPDLNPGVKRKRSSSVKMVRLFVNVGMMDVDNKGQLLNFICKYGSISGHSIGKIDLRKTHSYFDAEANVVDKLKQNFKNLSIAGREVRLNRDEQKPSEKSSYKGNFKKRGHKKKKKKRNREW